MLFNLFKEINPIDEEYVKELIESILTNGWKGAPILFHESIGLITGSHRTKALEVIEEMYYNDELTEEQEKRVQELADNENYLYDVTYIIDEWMEENPEESWEYDNLGHIFEGTEVEEWKNEISEW